jgi:serine phosphatase RsbU (regulator of sigma subunit)
VEIQIAVAKTNRFSYTESGDNLEVIERPNGGLSIVLADGQSSGHEAKLVSSHVVHKVINLLAEGVRDGAAARAASDQLFTDKNGLFPVYLNIISIDLQTQTIVITRNNPTPIFLARVDSIECLVGESTPIGTSRNIRPAITELQLEANTTIVVCTDGLTKAGLLYGLSMDVCTLLKSMLEEQNPTAQWLADTLLSNAIRMDQGRPNDDMSVVVLRIISQPTDHIRRMTVRLPVEEVVNTRAQ